MAVSYTNIAGIRLERLAKLIRAEFGAMIPVFYTEPDRQRAPEWFEIQLVRSEPIGDPQAFSVVRRYFAEVLYLTQKTAEDWVTQQKNRLDMAAHMERFLVSIGCHTEGSTYYWHDARVGAIDYDFDTSERADDNLSGVRIEWSFVVHEAIS